MNDIVQKGSGGVKKYQILNVHMSKKDISLGEREGVKQGCELRSH